MQTNELLQELIETVKVGGDAATFLGEAFISFYRGGKTKSICATPASWISGTSSCSWKC